MEFVEMIKLAKETLNPRELFNGNYAGSVAAVIESESGNIYKGVCIDTSSSMGFCAEHSAIGSMITGGENKIVKCVAVYKDGTVIAPCGRCREFMSQIHEDNLNAQIMVNNGIIVKLSELLPYRR